MANKVRHSPVEGARHLELLLLLAQGQGAGGGEPHVHTDAGHHMAAAAAHGHSACPVLQFTSLIAAQSAFPRHGSDSSRAVAENLQWLTATYINK